MKITIVTKAGNPYTLENNVSLHLEQGTSDIGIPGNLSASQTKNGVTESICTPLDNVSKILIEL